MKRYKIEDLTNFFLLALLVSIAVLIGATSYINSQSYKIINRNSSTISLIDPSKDPIQRITFDQSIKVKKNNIDLEIKPEASYNISARVVSRNTFLFDAGTKISPIDLALAWGKLSDHYYDRYISYSQSDRWYYFNYKKDSPLRESYIYKHSANTHIIPANINVEKGVKSIKVNDVINLQGYLVNIKGNINGGEFWWNSSLSRNDTGDGSCEVFYVNRAVIADRLYE